MQEIRTVGLTAHWGKDGLDGLLRQMRHLLQRHSINCVAEPRWAGRLGWDNGLDWDLWPDRVDLVISLGGDGTILNLVPKIASWGIPLASINAGRLGFLTTTTLERIEHLINHLSRKSYLIEQRSLLLASFTSVASGEKQEFTALNEISVVRGRTGRMVKVDASINGELLNHYHADGVIVATPTGSTAYSLSAGGPLIDPGCGVFCITPICPHSLSNRSLVVPDTAEISLVSRHCDREEIDDGVLLSVDGQELCTLASGDCVRVTKSPYSLKLLHLPGHSFPRILRTKLRWTGGEV